MVPPRHYCVVSNPVARDEENQVLFDQSGQAKLRHADLEIRLTQDPFPLYPGEEIQQVCVVSGPGFFTNKEKYLLMEDVWMLKVDSSLLFS